MYLDIVKSKKVSDGYFEGIFSFLRKKSAESLRKGTKNKNIEPCFVKKYVLTVIVQD
ncbi:hypothetical protein NRK67_14450 [Fusobacteria bacterium ZRK30]|nr:hypothetical protein NRK67_14450 [Fusobacteria bacterium ZRK30]